MSCPVCDVALGRTVSEGIEIDYCPECRGVWLDRGELDKIIERSMLMPTGDVPPDDRAAHSEPVRSSEGVRPAAGDVSDPSKRTSRRSLLADLFDFEG